MMEIVIAIAKPKVTTYLTPTSTFSGVQHTLSSTHPVLVLLNIYRNIAVDTAIKRTLNCQISVRNQFECILTPLVIQWLP